MQIKHLSGIIFLGLLSTACSCGKDRAASMQSMTNDGAVLEDSNGYLVGFGKFSQLDERAFFALNSAVLSSEAKATLDKHIELIKSVDQPVDFIIEGHCDERGTREYNIALGNQRAEAVKKYMVSKGIDASRLSTVSYGKEKPFATGHSEKDWSQNRTSIIVLSN